MSAKKAKKVMNIMKVSTMHKNSGADGWDSVKWWGTTAPQEVQSLDMKKIYVKEIRLRRSVWLFPLTLKTISNIEKEMISTLHQQQRSKSDHIRDQ